MSDPTELPGEVRRLLAGPVDSLEKMEVLRLCWEEPAKVWTVADARDRLRLPLDLVISACNDLTDAGFLAGVGNGYRFAPTGPDAAASTQLCRLYDGDRLLVIREMTALAMDRIRNSAARAFSDAFRIRRRDPGKGDSDA